MRLIVEVQWIGYELIEIDIGEEFGPRPSALRPIIPAASIALTLALGTRVGPVALSGSRLAIPVLGSGRPLVSVLTAASFPWNATFPGRALRDRRRIGGGRSGFRLGRLYIRG
jgi:hypothetical protein